MKLETERSRTTYCACTATSRQVKKKVRTRIPCITTYKHAKIVHVGTPVNDNLSQSLSVEAAATANASGTTTEPFEKFDPLIHGGVANASRTRSATKKPEILSIPFVKKYIQYAKAKQAPVLTKGAADWIVQVYASLRNDELEGNNKKV